MGTSESDGHAAELGGDVVDIGHCLGVDETVLDQLRGTWTFFSARRTTQSRPRMPMEVSPQLLTALKAYSTW
jgi:hypothetical protein